MFEIRVKVEHEPREDAPKDSKVGHARVRSMDITTFDPDEPRGVQAEAVVFTLLGAFLQASEYFMNVHKCHGDVESPDGMCKVKRHIHSLRMHILKMQKEMYEDIGIK